MHRLRAIGLEIEELPVTGLVQIWFISCETSSYSSCRETTCLELSGLTFQWKDEAEVELTNVGRAELVHQNDEQCCLRHSA